MDAQIKRYLGAIEHQWPEASPENHEINLLFEVEITNIDTSASPMSLEPHLEFVWADIESLGSLNLQPAPLQKYIADSVGNTCAFWASTVAD